MQAARWGGESEDDITADDILFAETQSEQLRQAEAGAEAGEVVVVETPHVSVSWAGLEEVKQLTGSLGEVASSSCIPSVSTVGGWQLLIMYYISTARWRGLSEGGHLQADDHDAEHAGQRGRGVPRPRPRGHLLQHRACGRAGQQHPAQAHTGGCQGCTLTSH